MRTLVLMMGLLLATSAAAAKDHTVRGHVIKKATYVAPSRATNPKRTQRDNDSSKLNVNPHNGKQGARTPQR
jgi:hypothetical protein